MFNAMTAQLQQRQMAIERRSMSPSRTTAAAGAASAAGAATETARVAAGVGLGGDAPRDEPFIHVITLNDGEHADSTLYRVQRGEVLQWVPGPSLLGRKVFLYTNYVDEGSDFVRAQYSTLPWWRGAAEGEGAGEGAEDGPRQELGTGVVVTDTGMFCELRPARPGSFHYYFVYETDGGSGPAGSGWWGVPPRVGGAGPGSVAPDEVCGLTVLTKCLGPLPRWERALRPARDAGYNLIHFTPIQELGSSQSSYSLAAQLRLDARLAGDPRRRATYADVEAVLQRLRDQHQLLAICDLVLNHTANNTWWLAEHPEATYNCVNSPHLRPAALVDAALAALSVRIGRGSLAGAGVGPALQLAAQLGPLRAAAAAALAELRLHECYCADADALLQDFLQRAKNRVPATSPPADEELSLLQDPQYRRLRSSVDMEVALRLYHVREGAGGGAGDEEARLRACGARFRAAVDRLNEAAAAAVAGHLRAAVDNVVAGASYHFLAADGPRLGVVSAQSPLVPRYFTWPAGVEGPDAAALGGPAESAAWGPQGAFVQAHNGWVMGADPLVDFAAAGHVYLRRELVAWGDSVKLRYGRAPEDCPFLWAHMREYVELTAEVFCGVRLDNCHSTPLHVAEWLLDAARAVRPELYVLAELFTDSDALDNMFVNRLGITSLVREAMSAGDAHELGRLVYRYGGRPVGAFLRPRRAAARAEVAHALFMDLTHDNPSPLERRSVWHALPGAALVAAAACGAGSTRGLDALVPHHVHVVDEERLYPAPGEEGAEGEEEGEPLGPARRALNELHGRLAREGYTEVYVDQLDEAVVAVTRHCPATRRSVVVVVVTAFSEPPLDGGQPAPRAAPARPLRLEGELEAVLLDLRLLRHQHADFTRDARYINGLRGFRCVVRAGAPLAACDMFSGERRDGPVTELAWGALRPGAVAVLAVAPRPEAAAALARTQRALGAPLALEPPLGADLERLNALLYRCEEEERAATAGAGGVYVVPGHGPLVYAGLQGAVSLLATVEPGDDLGHPLCDNLRQGDWLLEYTWRRAGRELPAWGARARELLQPLAELPRALQPAYAAAALRRLHALCVREAARQLRGAGGRGARGELWRALALTSVQLVGAVPGAALPAQPPQPTLSAGLPHFAAGYMRCWGRDTFVSLRGLLLLTGRAADARAHLLGYAACLRHGLIPNLLDGGAAARYNCRDAVWWWLQALQQYCEQEGYDILAAPVGRLYPRDDSPAPPPGVTPPPAQATQPLHDTVQEALDTHFQGLVFRERGAGPGIDEYMSPAGFSVALGLEPDCGFPRGGSEHNAGTWMDKMGSSEQHATRGRPATPRDGSAVELVGLAYSCAAWLARAHRAGHYPHAGLARRGGGGGGGAAAWGWREWADKIKANFERHFWVPAAPSALDARPDLVHRRGVYKDTVGASRPWADYQLRCNFPIAMVVAPDLFTPSNARRALATATELLAGPLGMKTLDPADWGYRPDYDNGDCGADPATAHGYNYHQGPEWGWPLGFLLRARLLFPAEGGRAEAAAVRAALGPAARELRASPWRGLPELTNHAGAFCRDSCSSQAWTNAVMLEVLEDLHRAEDARDLPAVD